MSNIRVEFKINASMGNSEDQESKRDKVREILEARLQKLRESIEQNRLDSVSSVSHECDVFEGRERWKIYLEGKGGLEDYATSLRNEIASVLSEEDVLLVSVLEDT